LRLSVFARLIFSSSRKDLPAVGNCKEIVVARYFFRRPLRLGDFAACPAELRGAKFFFYFLLAQRRRDAKESPSIHLSFLVPCLSTAGRPLKPTITVKNALFKNFFARTILISKNLPLHLNHHQEPV
jgi:hypothetical protein